MKDQLLSLFQTAARAAAILYWSCDPAEAEGDKQRSNDIARVKLAAPSAVVNKYNTTRRKVEHLVSQELGHQKGLRKGQGRYLLNGWS